MIKRNSRVVAWIKVRGKVLIKTKSLTLKRIPAQTEVIIRAKARFNFSLISTTRKTINIPSLNMVNIIQYIGENK